MFPLLVSTGKEGAQAYLGSFRAHLQKYVRKQTSLDEVFTLRDLQVHLKSPDCYAELVGDETSLELKLRLHDRVPLSGAVTVAEQMRLQHEFEEAAPSYAPPRPLRRADSSKSSRSSPADPRTWTP